MTQQTELEFSTKICSGCGAPCRIETEDGLRWCIDCAIPRYFLCNHCGKWHLRIGEKFTYSRNSSGFGNQICFRCRDEYYNNCECCKYFALKTDIRVYENHSYCRFCYDRMFVCVGCRRRLFSDQYFDAGLCRPCYDEERRIINPDHLAKPPLEFHGKGPHFYGIELEVECDEKVDRKANIARQILKSLNGFAIAKHDGSIKDKNGRVIGFEIVTVPASRQVQMEKWNVFFDQLPKGLRSYDTKTCGLHIHCARNPLSQLTIAKMLLFINSKDNSKFVTTVAGRPPNTYCQIKNKSYRDAKPRLQDRYEALNLSNKATVEFRIFRGTLKRESLFKSLEFCDALIHFCKDCQFSVLDTRRVDKFVEYVKISSKEWPHLWAFICARWLRIENKLTKLYKFPLPEAPAEIETYNNEPNPALQIYQPQPTNVDDWDDDFVEEVVENV